MLIEKIAHLAAGAVSRCDVIIAVLVAVLTGKVLLPVWRHFARSLKMNWMAGSERGHWFYGHLNQYPQSERGLLGFFKDIHKFPAMFNYWIGPFLSLTQLYHPDLNKVVLATSAPKARFAYDMVRPWIGDGLLTTEGDKWKRHRKLITPAFHFNMLRRYTETFNRCSQVLHDKWKLRMGAGQDHVTIDVSKHLNLMTLDVILQCAMSSRTDCQSDSGSENSYIRAVHEVSDTVVGRIDNPLLQLEFFFKLSSTGRRFYRSVDVLHRNTAQIIAARKELYKSEKSGNDRESVDFLDMLLNAKDEKGNGLSDLEIRDEVETFLFEGHDTTSSGLSWLFYNLARHPDIQERCRQEVNRVVPADEQHLNASHLSGLTYLSQCVKESLRLHPPVYVIGRTLDRDLPVACPHVHQVDRNGLKLPDETNVIVNIFTQHRNPFVWENPGEFDPDRFSKENICKIGSHDFIPFSAGPRNCIGQNFAMNEMKVVMAQTLRNFRLSVSQSDPAPVLTPLLVLRSCSGINITFRKID